MRKTMSLAYLVETCQARVWPETWMQNHSECIVKGMSVDTRSLAEGELFVALKGSRQDGHECLSAAKATGAVAALVEKVDKDVELLQLQVSSVVDAMLDIGRAYRQQLKGPVVAITGSSGKTTVKDMVAKILSIAYEPVCSTQGNLNNELGVPLSLSRIKPSHRSGVFELGANHRGEIARNVSMVMPNIALITNAGDAHVGEFGGLDKIVEAKGELLLGLSENGVAILNKDDPAFEQWAASVSAQKILSFGLTPNANVHAHDLKQQPEGHYHFTLVTSQGRAQVQLQLLGLHNVCNALAASAVGVALEIEPQAIAHALSMLEPNKGRVSIEMIQGMRVIDDTYNANPSAVKSAIDLLKSFDSWRVLVLGDMGELGEWSQKGHADVGHYAKGRIDALYTVGQHSKSAFDAFSSSKDNTGRAFKDGGHFADMATMIDALKKNAPEGTSVLIKGSRSAGLEKAIELLKQHRLES